MDAMSGISSSPASFGVSNRAGGAGDFSASLSAAIGGVENRAAGQDPRAAAEELVAITLVQPILSQLRDSDLGAEPFAATDGEKRFGALYDAEIARRIVSSGRFPLVDALARQMRERSESAGALPQHGTEADTHGTPRDAFERIG